MAESVLLALNTIFQDVLDVKDIQLQPETTANDIVEWDSVNHLILIYAIEEHFHIKFDLEEIMNFRSVGDICNCINQKLT